MSKDRSYAAKKARMDRDPEFKARVLAAQARSRRARREREFAAHVERFGDRVCGWVYGNDRRCWRTDAHTHTGQQAPS